MCSVCCVCPVSEHGFIGYSPGLLSSNTMPDYTPGETFFTVFGVFFPAATGEVAPVICFPLILGAFYIKNCLSALSVAVLPFFLELHMQFKNTFLCCCTILRSVCVCACVCIGVMAGFNMSSDLQRPENNIPVGTLAAVFTSYDTTSTHKNTHNNTVKWENATLHSTQDYSYSKI